MTIFVVGAAEAQDLWEVDTDRGTVRALSAGMGADQVDPTEWDKIQAIRQTGSTVVKAVSFAVAVPQTSDLSFRQLTVNV